MKEIDTCLVLTKNWLLDAWQGSELVLAVGVDNNRSKNSNCLIVTDDVKMDVNKYSCSGPPAFKNGRWKLRFF